MDIGKLVEKNGVLVEKKFVGSKDHDADFSIGRELIFEKTGKSFKHEEFTFKGHNVLSGCANIDSDAVDYAKKIGASHYILGKEIMVSDDHSLTYQRPVTYVNILK